MKLLEIYNNKYFTLLSALILSLMLIALFINYPQCSGSVDNTVKIVYISVAIIFFIKEVIKVILKLKQ